MVTFTAFTTAGRYFCNNNLFLENDQIPGDENENKDQNDQTSGENENNDLSRVDSSRTTTLIDTDSAQTGTRFQSTVPTGDHHHHDDIYKITLKYLIREQIIVHKLVTNMIIVTHQGWSSELPERRNHI